MISPRIGNLIIYGLIILIGLFLVVIAVYSTRVTPTADHQPNDNTGEIIVAGIGTIIACSGIYNFAGAW